MESRELHITNWALMALDSTWDHNLPPEDLGPGHYLKRPFPDIACQRFSWGDLPIRISPISICEEDVIKWLQGYSELRKPTCPVCAGLLNAALVARDLRLSGGTL